MNLPKTHNIRPQSNERAFFEKGSNLHNFT